MYIEVFWTLGSMFTAGAAWLLLGAYGWRWLGAVCASPILFSLVGAYLAPESPRWLMVQGRTAEARVVLEAVARTNGKAHLLPAEWELVASASSASPAREQQQQQQKQPQGVLGPLKELCASSGLRATTALVVVVWFGFGLTYYGIILFNTRIFSTHDSDRSDETCSFDYQSIFVSSTSEIFGLAGAVATIDRLGRRGTQGGFYVVCGIFSFLLGTGLHTSPLTACAFVARACAMAASCATWVAAPELFPTRVRSTGFSVANSSARVGASLAPYLVESDLTVFAVAAVLAAGNFVSAAAAVVLPETKGLSLDETPKGTSSGVLGIPTSEEAVPQEGDRASTAVSVGGNDVGLV